MPEQWRVQDHESAVSGIQAAELITRRLSEGRFETWFETDSGRSLAIVSNGVRALVMVLEHPGDAGEHAVDPNRAGHQDGYVLSNGQADIYANRDTVPLADGLRIVQHVVDHGGPPPNAAWQVDR